MRSISTSRPAPRGLVALLLALSLLLAACTPAGAPATPQTTAVPSLVPPTTAAQASPASATATPPRTPAAQAAPTQASIAPAAGTVVAAATPAVACTPGAAPTAALTEGPYYKANPPQRTSLLEPGVGGTRLTISGYVLSADCRPLVGARVDFWQADDRGQYDNSGYRLRGYQLTDANGRYSLETIVPGIYPGRTRHLHVKVQAPNRLGLTSQLYFPNEPLNASDRIFSDRLVMAVTDGPQGKAAVFDFVLAAG